MLFVSKFCACEPSKAAAGVLAVVDPVDVLLAFFGGGYLVQSAEEVEPSDDEEAEEHAASISRGVLVRELGFEAAEEVFDVAFFGECCGRHGYFLFSPSEFLCSVVVVVLDV
jgi:hypothetical protein